jgi:hypothetical protein
MDSDGRSALDRAERASAAASAGPASWLPPRRASVAAAAAALLAGCMANQTVVFRRASDGSEAVCERPARISDLRSEGRKRFRACMADLESRGYARVDSSATVGTSTPDVAATAPDPGEIAAQIAGLEAQIRSRSRYLGDRLTPQQAEALMPFVRSVMDGALRQGSGEVLKRAQQELDALVTQVRMRRDVRDELYGMLEDWARLTALQDASARIRSADGGEPDLPAPPAPRPSPSIAAPGRAEAADPRRRSPALQAGESVPAQR